MESRIKRQRMTLVSDNDLAWLAANLAVALNDIRCQERMSINAIRQALRHLPGGKDATMRYGNMGRTQIFKIGDEEVEVGPDATASDIEAALERKKKVLNIP